MIGAILGDRFLFVLPYIIKNVDRVLNKINSRITIVTLARYWIGLHNHQFLIIIGLTIKFFINLKTYSLKFFSIPFLFALTYLVNGLLIQNSSLFVFLIFIYYITYKKYMYYKINGFFFQICTIVFLTYFLFNIEIVCNNNFLNELCLKQLYLYIIILFNI